MAIATGDHRWAWFFGLLLIALAPLLLSPVPPLNDYPSHLARVHILANIDDSPWLQNYYAIEWLLVPRLATELVALPLAKLFSAETAMLIVAALTLAVLASSVLAVHRALFRNSSLLPLAAFLLLYNRQFLWGTLSFLLALGVGFWFFVAWVALKERSAALRAAILAVPVCLIFVGHVLACWVLLVMLVGFEVGRLLFVEEGERRRFGGLGASLLLSIVPVIAFAGFTPHGEQLSQIGGYDAVVRAIGLIGPVLNYVPAVDLATAVLLAVVICAGLVTRRLILHRLMIVPVAILAILYAALPDTLFGMPGVGRRMIVPLAFMIVASLDFHDIEIRLERWVCVVFLAVFVFRMGIIAAEWWRVRPFYADLAQAIDHIDEGSRVYTVLLQPLGAGLMSPPARYVAALAVARRNALADGIHQDGGAQIVQYRDSDNGETPRLFRGLRRKPGDAGEGEQDLFAEVDGDRFEFAWLINPHALPVKSSFDRNAVAYVGPYVTLVRLPYPLREGRPGANNSPED